MARSYDIAILSQKVEQIEGSIKANDVVANPTGEATADLSKVQIDGTIYGVSDVKANPTGDATAALSSISIDSTKYTLDKNITFASVWTGTAYQVNDTFDISDFSESKIYVFVFRGFSGSYITQFVTLPLDKLQFIIQGDTTQYIRYRMEFVEGTPGRYKITDKLGTGDAGAGLVAVYEIGAAVPVITRTSKKKTKKED